MCTNNGGDRDSWDNEGGAISGCGDALSEALREARVIDEIGSFERAGARRATVDDADADDFGSAARELLARLDGLASFEIILSQLIVRGHTVEEVFDAILELRDKGAIVLVERRVARGVVGRERRRAAEPR